MGRLAGFTGNQVASVAESLEWKYERTTGDHMVFKKTGVVKNLSIPDHRSVSEGTLRDLVKTMGLSVDQFLGLVKK